MSRKIYDLLQKSMAYPEEFGFYFQEINKQWEQLLDETVNYLKENGFSVDKQTIIDELPAVQSLLVRGLRNEALILAKYTMGVRHPRVSVFNNALILDNNSLDAKQARLIMDAGYASTTLEINEVNLTIISIDSLEEGLKADFLKQFKLSDEKFLIIRAYERGQNYESGLLKANSSSIQ